MIDSRERLVAHYSALLNKPILALERERQRRKERNYAVFMWACAVLAAICALMGWTFYG